MQHADENDLKSLKKPAVIFFLLVPVLVLLFRSLLGYNGLYGQDAFEYQRYADQVLHGFHKGAYPPPFHWPVLYPVLGAVIGLVTGQTDFALQLLSFLSFSGALYFTFRILHLLHGNGRAALVYVLVFGLLSPYFLRLGVCVMSDMLGIFFLTASVFYMLRFTIEKKRNDIIPALCLALAAKLTRIPAPVVLLIPFIFFSGALFRRMSYGRLLIALGLCAVLLLPEKMLNGSIDLRMQAEEWSFAHYFSTGYENPFSGALQYMLPNILFVLTPFVHPGYLLIAPLLVFFLKKEDFNRHSLYFLLLPALLYLVFLGGFAYQNIRLNTFVFPLVLAFFFPAFLRFHRKFLVRKAMRNVFTGTALVFQLVLFWYAFDDFYLSNRLEQKIAAHMKQHHSGIPVYTQGMGPALEHYKVKYVYGLAGADTTCAPKLVLIETAGFEKQWKGKPPYEKWKYLKEKCSLKKITTFERGWDLYATQ
jgi:hypothetical protein